MAEKFSCIKGLPGWMKTGIVASMTIFLFSREKKIECRSMSSLATARLRVVHEITFSKSTKCHTYAKQSPRAFRNGKLFLARSLYFSTS